MTYDISLHLLYCKRRARVVCNYCMALVYRTMLNEAKSKMEIQGLSMRQLLYKILINNYTIHGRKCRFWNMRMKYLKYGRRLANNKGQILETTCV